MNESFAQEIDVRPTFVQHASKAHQQLWESLPIKDKMLLENQASLRVLDTDDKITRFFESRDFSMKSQRSFVVARPLENINEHYDPIVSAMNQLRK